jgi:drug/metabolite transporter (DMT)-like permease
MRAIRVVRAIRAIGATRAAIFNNLVPVFAVIFSVFILQENVSWYTWLGGLLVISGVLFVNLPPKSNI